ncbi:class I SAM-dependent methyltransferase [Roseovarius aestuariivivens]|uniref:class I SAM-dependent methyltransferase n=1 Tax=Roseovarius aestuariivivens TaxID=1888910 RepID=UPI001FDA885B|nr:class I SAM-dependent methyltransferase [Roseovarius aestuariivivens]
MTEDEAFLALYRDMTRQGPGTPEDVQWALSQIALPEAPRVVDAGCGPGADLVTLAKALPHGRIEGVEQLEHLAQEAHEATRGFTNVQVFQGDMAEIEGPCDLIWCAGALYFLGVAEGLRTWRTALAPGGAVAFSEPVLEPGAPDAARDFWTEYPALTDFSGLEARVHDAGFEIFGAREIKGLAWAGYYAELSARIAALRDGAGTALSAVLDAAEREISLWRQAPGHVEYRLILARPRLVTV